MHNLMGKGTFVSPQLTSIAGYSFIVIDPNYDIDISQYVSVLRLSGVKILVACNLSDPKLDIKKLSNFIESTGVDGLVISVKNDNLVATKLLKNIRMTYPDLFIGLCTYRFPSLTKIKYRNLLARCDAIMPYFNIEKVKDSVPQMRRILQEWNALTSKPIVPIITCNKEQHKLVDYLRGNGVSGVCFSSPNVSEWDARENPILIGTIVGTEWLATYRSLNDKRVSFYHNAKDKVSVYEICGNDIWVRTDKGWSHIAKDNKVFMKF